ncbi:hypothetical protein PYW07_003483 [Mythimna separata]|uniref:Carboxylic ester hydrolase n=1 Tax=Mythimna separata TaxID=271217 RepID=A0AAD7YJU3_MYTSE|nr:hypothetical protein PYW07_003483 [Mythimna separata]
MFLLVLFVSYTNANTVLVQVEQGSLKGEILQRSTGNGEYCSFKGIPYAAPPVGELRFKDPQPPLPWKGERDALSHGAICPQIDIAKDQYKSEANEDCLFLNVYTPTVKPKTPLPVMFYLHGGFLIIGSGNSDKLGPDFLLDHDVVLVTINYRLGVLGFLSFDTEETPGNAGLKDQVAALKWVKKNIAKFGGDPDNVSIFGQSAGGASVTLHLISPMSKGLFKRAIAMSGVYFKDFNLPFEHVRRAFLLTQQLGLKTQDPKKAMQFLKSAPVEKLATHTDDIPYLFAGTNPLLKLNKTNPSYKMIVQTCTLYTNFAKYGTPTTSRCPITWKVYGQEKNYLEIGSKLIPKTADKQPEIDFWRDIYESVGIQFS